MSEPRKSRKPHRLPKDWRWLRVGEWSQKGDVSCDPRTQPIEIILGYPIGRENHPVRRRLK